MTDDERRLFHELIVSTQKLCIVTDNAAEVLSEQFQSMVTGPLEETRAILAKCPQPTEEWDGTLREEDLYREFYANPGRPGSEEVGVRIKHSITGITRESYSKTTRDDNERVAFNSLASAVMERFKAMKR